MTKIDLNGIAETARFVKNVQKQVAFAASKAINRTAIEVQNHEVQKELPGSLKIRSPWLKPRTKFGVNIRFASKARLFASVGSQAPWLALVEKGGTKLPPRKALPIPTDNIDTSRRRKRGEKPKALLATKRAFVLKLKKGGGGIFMRMGPGKNQLKALYIFKDQAKVDDILNFFEAGRDVVNRRYISIFSDELTRAIATAK